MGLDTVFVWCRVAKHLEVVHLHEYKGDGFVFSLIQTGKGSVFWTAACSAVYVRGGVCIHPVGHSPLSQGLIVSIGEKKKKKKSAFEIDSQGQEKARRSVGRFILPERMLEQGRLRLGNWLFRVCRCIQILLLNVSKMFQSKK